MIVRVRYSHYHNPIFLLQKLVLQIAQNPSEINNSS